MASGTCRRALDEDLVDHVDHADAKLFRHWHRSRRCLPSGQFVNAYDPLPAQMMIPIVGQFASEAAIIIQLAYMSALAPHAELLRGADGEGDRPIAARVKATKANLRMGSSRSLPRQMPRMTH
jgi:hypothetical protein